MILSANLYVKYKSKIFEIEFQKNIERLRIMWGYETHRETIDHAEKIMQQTNINKEAI